MRIVIDMQGAQTESRFRGIGRYTLSFAQAIVRNRGEHEVMLALSGLFPDTIESIRAAFDDLLPQENIRVWRAPGPVAEEHPSNEARREVAELIREAFLASLAPDVIHISSLFEGYVDDAVTSIGRFDRVTPVSVSLYDLIPLLNPAHYLDPNPRYAQYYRRKVEHLKKATCLLAISEFTRQEGLAHLDSPASRVVNISTAIEPCFCPLRIDDATVAQLRQKFGLTRLFILYTGGADERKNLPRLIQAYAALPAALRAGYQLVLAGQIHEVPCLNKFAKSAGLKLDELCFTGYVSDDELVALYNLCQLFVFPSWHEGFGLPALEAMACGAPVIGANTSSLPEVIGLPAALFDPMDVADITAKMGQALTDEAMRATLRWHGLAQAKKFSWDETAKRAMAAWEALEQPSARSYQDACLSEARLIDAVATQRKVSDLIGGARATNLLESIARIECACQPTEDDLIQTADCIAFSLSRGGDKQLFLDISVIVHGDAKSGIQRVVRSLLRELIENPPQEFEIRPIYFDGARYRYATKFTASFIGSPTKDVSEEIVDFCQDDIYLALDLNAHLTAAVHELHMQLQLHGVKLYFVVYDILLVQHPEWWPEGTGTIFDAWLRSISQISTGLICISEAVSDEVRAWLKQNPPQRLSGPTVRSFHLGADIENSMPSKGMPTNAHTVLTALARKPSFLMVGTVEPRKGYVQALGAFELLWGQGGNVNLVIVGKEGWLVDVLVQKLRSHQELNKRLFWLEGVSDEYLEKIYAASTCLLAPSEGEGFGLPLIEAAQHKKPIIARNMPVFCEVAGENAYYFNGHSPNDLAIAINEWIALNHNNYHPKSEGMSYLSWRESALQLQEQLNLIAKH